MDNTYTDIYLFLPCLTELQLQTFAMRGMVLSYIVKNFFKTWRNWNRGVYMMVMRLSGLLRGDNSFKCIMMTQHPMSMPIKLPIGQMMRSGP